jgi:hypothetical protein
MESFFLNGEAFRASIEFEYTKHEMEFELQ